MRSNARGRTAWPSFLVLLCASVVITVLGSWYWIRQIESSYLETWAQVNEAEAKQRAVELSNLLKRGESQETVLHNLQSQLSATPFDETNFTCLINTNTIVLSHPNPKMVGMDLHNARVEMLEDGRKVSMREHLKAPFGPIIFQSSEERPKQLVYQVAIPDTPWRISVHTNVAEILLHLNQIEKQVAITGIPLMLLLSFLGGLCVYFVSRNYELRLERINQQLDRKVDERTAELRETLNQLEVEKERAESADRLKTEFLHTMGHEYRTPLNGILGLSEMLKETVDEDLKDVCDSIYLSGKRLHEVIERVLRFSELEAGKALPVPSETDLSEISNELDQKYKPLAEAKFLSWNMVSTLSDEKFFLDKSWFIEAVSLLIENAVKFTKIGSVKVSLSLKQRSNADNPLLVAVIEDTGVGIQQDKQSEIFDLFRQADQTDTRAFEGIGIGLTMCQRLINLMDGRLFLRNREKIT